MSTPVKIYGMENPLLDISCEVSAEFLEKYGLKSGNAILAEPQHMPIFQELAAMPDVKYIAGGSALNSMRVAQWMTQIPGVVFYNGAIGKDEFGVKLRENATKDGVTMLVMETEVAPTGTCAVCIVGKERSLVAALGAAEKFVVEHMATEAVQAALKSCGIFYCGGFFLTVCPDAMQMVGKHAAETNSVFALNFSAPFIPQFFGSQLDALLPYVDILFGNETEAEAFAQAKSFPDPKDLPAVAKQIAALPKINAARPRIVIITQGKDPVIIFQHGDESHKTFPTPPVAADSIVDTNGAGDSFVGGFLSQLALGHPIERCVAAGHYAAGVVIQHSGCSFPPTPSFVA